MTPTEAKRIAGTYGLTTTFDPASDCDVLHPPGDTDAGVWMTLRQTSEKDFIAACLAMVKQRKPLEAAPPAPKPLTEREIAASCKLMSRKAEKPPEAVAAAPMAEAKPEPAKEQTMTTGSIYTRLLKFQRLPLAIHKNNSANLGGRGSYRYADLPSVLEVIRPALSECGLVLIQIIDGESLVTRLIDAETGEAIESRFPMPFDGLNWHGIGSAISYARRYATLSLLSLAPDDDDAASTMPANNDRARAAAAAAVLADECFECGGPMEIGPKTGKPFCRSCWQAKRNGSAVHN